MNINTFIPNWQTLLGAIGGVFAAIAVILGLIFGLNTSPKPDTTPTTAPEPTYTRPTVPPTVKEM